MDEADFDSSTNWRPFEAADTSRFEAQAGRCTSLAIALWGKTSGDLQRQLQAPYPAIPAGFELTDFRKLQHWVQSMIATCFGDPRFSWLPRSILSTSTISVGIQRLTEGEARLALVRRAIDYRENH